MLKKRASYLVTLHKAAEHEMFQFKIINKEYTINQLINLGLETKIPNLIKLNKLYDNVKIKNFCNVPTLHYTLKTGEDYYATPN
jgi:hypothetical protein